MTSLACMANMAILSLKKYWQNRKPEGDDQDQRQALQQGEEHADQDGVEDDEEEPRHQHACRQAPIGLMLCESAISSSCSSASVPTLVGGRQGRRVVAGGRGRRRPGRQLQLQGGQLVVHLGRGAHLVELLLDVVHRAC